jgi:hypothetical protein
VRPPLLRVRNLHLSSLVVGRLVHTEKVIVEEAAFSTEQADTLGYSIARQIADAGRWPGGIRLRSEPLAPWKSRWRLLADDSSKPCPWQVELQTRLEMRLRVDRYGIFGDELPHEELVARLCDARRQIAAFVAQPFPYFDTHVNATVGVEPDPFVSDDERWLELHVAVTLFEV